MIGSTSNAQQRAWQAAHPGYGAAVKRRARATPEGREKSREAYRRWYAAHPERSKAKCHRRYEAKKPSYIASNAARRAKAPLSAVAPEEWVRIMESEEWRCVYCGGWAQTLDHVIPLARGGKHKPSNLVPACKSCNSRKHTSLAIDFIWRIA